MCGWKPGDTRRAANSSSTGLTKHALPEFNDNSWCATQVAIAMTVGTDGPVTQGPYVYTE